MNFKNRWKLAIDALNGDGGFYDGTYLSKYTREDDTKYELRKKSALYENFFDKDVSRYIGYLYKDKPTRTCSSAVLSRILQDCDNKGNDINIFMSNFAKEAKARGVGIVLVKMPSSIPDNLQAQIENRALPYFTQLNPEDLQSYTLTKNGVFLDVSFFSTAAINNKTEDVIIKYDDKKWYIIKDEKIVLSDFHGLSYCPAIIFSEKGTFPSVGEFTHIGEIAKKHYNQSSELDEILTAQTFNILTIQADNPSDVELKLSTDNAISYATTCNKPEFIAPDASPASTYMQKLEKLEKSIHSTCYNIDTASTKNESGISLEIKFQGLNGSLNSFASSLENFEKRLMQTAEDYLSIQTDINIFYPTDFNITDIEQEIKILDDINTLGYKLPTYKSIKLNKIINNDINNLSDKQKQDIQQEIEENFKE